MISGDDEVTKAEYVESLEKRDPNSGPIAAALFEQYYDKNDNDVLEKEDFKKFFKFMDKNGKRK